MSEKKQFKAESQRVLDLMIHSIYTHKEIFLRELLSNASDAIDKRYYQSLHGGESGLSRDIFEIQLLVDEDLRTLTVRDNGCGMSAIELEEHLGTIARSGSLQFKQEAESSSEIDVIGQFGVGFYAAFMVAAELTVISRKVGTEEAFRWHSEGGDGFTIEPAERTEIGTDIILKIKENEDQESFDGYLQFYHLQQLVKRYSDYIRYPIRMLAPPPPASETEETEEAEAKSAEPVWETLNSMSPLWRRSKSEITQEEYTQFYQDLFHDSTEPLRTIHISAEGTTSYQALLFLPKKAPYDFYHKEFEKGLKLYANGVMIMEHCQELLPDCFRFVRGVVDAEDLSLNISRELLQQDKQLRVIARNLEKKIKTELSQLQEEDRAAYHEFYQVFGLSLKYALYSSYGMQRELLLDLLEFPTTNKEQPLTLKEYLAEIPESQDCIYYASAETPARVKTLPQCERLTEQGCNVLCLCEDVDEFLIQMLHEVDSKPFRSVSQAEAIPETEEEKEALKKAAEATVFAALERALDGKITKAQPTLKLKTHPVCLSASEAGPSLEMERILSTQPGAEKRSAKAERILEINVNHPLYQTITALSPEEPRFADMALVLYGQALLLEGLALEDPIAFSNALGRVMTQS